MKYKYFILFILITNLISAQEISYGIGVGLPYSSNRNSSSTTKFTKSAQYSISIGFKTSISNRDFTEIRYSTFKSQRSVKLEPIPFSYSIRNHLIEIQKYTLELDMSNAGTIDFGLRVSLLLKTNIEGTIATPSNNIVPVMSSDFDKSNLIRIHLLAKYSIGSISLNDRFKLRPTYVFSLATSGDNNFPFVNTGLFGHTFELTFISDISTKAR